MKFRAFSGTPQTLAKTAESWAKRAHAESAVPNSLLDYLYGDERQEKYRIFLLVASRLVSEKDQESLGYSVHLSSRIL